MKIAYILSSLANAGPINVAVDLVKVMVAHGHFCKVFYFDEIVENHFPCEVKRISFKSKLDLNDFDVVHTHGVRPDLFVFIKKPWKTKTRFISTLHSFIFEDHAFEYGKVKAFFTTRITLACTWRHHRIIVLSKNAVDYYARWIPRRKLTYAYNTRIVSFDNQIPADDAKTIADFKQNHSRIIGAIGGLTVRKGLDQIIKALPSFPGTGFLIIGDGPALEDLKTLAKKQNVQNRVLFIGKRDSAYRYLSCFDIFAIPSRSEGFPLALLEAAAYRKAIVSSDIPVFKEIFDSDEISRFALENIEDAVRAIKAAFSEKNKLAANAYSKYVNFYSPECFYSRHISIYRLQ